MKTAIQLNNKEVIYRVIKDGLVNYKKEKYLVYDSNGRYAIDLDLPIRTYLDTVPEDKILQKAQDILMTRYKRTPNLFMESPEAFKTLLRARTSGLAYEVFNLIMLDNRHRLVEIKELFRGTSDSCSVFPKEVIRACIESSSSICAVAFHHNHPSQISEPSKQDLMITDRLTKALKLIDIRVLDHFISSDGHCVSLAERGEL